MIMNKLTIIIIINNERMKTHIHLKWVLESDNVDKT